ncbi:hypothetical protein FPZ42_03700 [Mucilaginibacter achroorhodeus]|uniref:Tetratricopeptide repeat protein n=1 Tax=Mucilaginibacter achroorhodeus TaxID=2599294 RepID=A0A563UAN1_9SPHI|nr:hypothetical protein [Mucilaginibacter achroorhodeus]TWR28329.1 hypothetical protein FPZ42_03700 [Mucilaginibacter achroorhodeus]
MDQYIDNRQKEIFWNLLANLADDGAAQLQSLERLLADHPQSAVLHMLTTRANGGKFAGKAAAYISPRLLHKYITNAQELPVVEQASITDLTYLSHGAKHTGATQSDGSRPEDAVLVDPYEELRETEVVETPQEESQPEVIAESQVQTAEPVIEEEPQDVEEGPVSEEGREIVTEVIVPEKSESDNIDEEPIEEIAEAPFVPVNAAIEAPQTEPVIRVADSEQVEEKQDEPANEPVTVDQLPEAPVEQPAAHDLNDEAPAETKVEEQAAEQPAVNEYRFTSRFPKREAPAAQEHEQPKEAEPIEDEVYDEIVGIDDIGFKPVTSEPNADTATEHRFSEPATEAGLEEDEPQSEVLFHQPDGDVEPTQDDKANDIHKEEEKLILGGIVGGDYLSFDKKLDELREASGYVAPRFKPREEEEQPEPDEAQKVPDQVQPATHAEQPAAHTEQAAASHIDPNHVSRYDDDKMPYTFLWWLDKTRKEHAENLRPYAETGLQQVPIGGNQNLKRPDELQQQYFENIFSLTTVSGVERDPEQERVQFNPEKKEDVIIERFIQTDPQIKPLSADKLDNENKAKRSSEDSNEVVTETLARIYADQMLYHKAIATYKKLILKFPEKSTYFAARIEELEKKTN